MEVSPLHGSCISSPICSSPSSSSSSDRPLSVLSRVSISARRNPRLVSSFRSARRRNLCSAQSSETLLAGKDGKPKHREVVSKKDEEVELRDLKSWMHKNGLPPCKVELKERPSHDVKHRPIHYVAASEDLQVGFLSRFDWVWFLIIGVFSLSVDIAGG
jgi:hypothetical protein